MDHPRNAIHATGFCVSFKCLSSRVCYNDVDWRWIGGRGEMVRGLVGKG